MAFKLASKTTTNRKSTQVDEDEYTGVWINFGVIVKDEEGNEQFTRFPRGVAVSDLDLHSIYAHSAERNPEWTQQALLINALIEKIREASNTLKEGESMPLNFSVQLYRRQEQIPSVEAPKIDMDLDKFFG